VQFLVGGVHSSKIRCDFLIGQQSPCGNISRSMFRCLDDGSLDVVAIAAHLQDLEQGASESSSPIILFVWLRRTKRTEIGHSTLLEMCQVDRNLGFDPVWSVDAALLREKGRV
jgi:hypothetical protein